MDNRNDLQWRPEDWEHTLGHLRKAERLLLLKTLGVGSAVVGTVATGAVLYMQPEVAEPKPIAEAIEVVTSVEPSKGSVQSPETIAWDEANALGSSPSEDSGVFDEINDADRTEVIETAGAMKSEAITEAFEAESTSESMGRMEEVESTQLPMNERLEADHPASLDLAFDAGRRMESSNPEEVSIDVAFKNLRYLRQIDPFEATPDLTPSLVSAPFQNELGVPVEASFTLPMRFSLLPLTSGAALEMPTTMGYLAGMRLELAPGLSAAAAEQHWSAWHPSAVFGAPDVLRRVNSDFAVNAHLFATMLKPVGHLLEVGVTAGLQREITRRLDNGVWDADADAWEDLEEANVWGLVEEANPWSGRAGLRLDYAVAPEWKVVAQAGVSFQRDFLRKQAPIEASTPSPLWIQIGIQR